MVKSVGGPKMRFGALCRGRCAFFVHVMTQFWLWRGRKAAGKGGKGDEKC